MNNKGFTLIELLAIVAILGVVGSIATTGVISAINTSKNKSESIFIDKLSNLIDEYLVLNKPTQTTGNTYTFTKCKNADCSSTYEATATQVKKTGNTSIYLNDLVESGTIEKEKLMNPSNKKNCLESGNGPEIKVYKDSDYVYYFYVDLSQNNTTCDISVENGIINTLPDSLKSKVGLS